MISTTGSPQKGIALSDFLLEAGDEFVFMAVAEIGMNTVLEWS